MPRNVSKGMLACLIAATISPAASAPSVPDFLGRSRTSSVCPSGARDRTTLVGDDANPFLTPETAAIHRKFGAISRSGKGFCDPNNQCWPEDPPDIYRQQRDQIVILYSFAHQLRHIRLNQSHPGSRPGRAIP